jgi:hypothetical protein
VTCHVPNCHADAIMQGVCSSHWLQADEATRGADRLEAEMRQVRADEDAAERRRIALLKEAARRRAVNPSDRRAERILDAIVARFYQEATDAGRNNALAGAAWAAGRLVAGGELAEKTAADRLVAEGVAAGLPAREAKDVVRGQFRHATRNPRVLERRSEWTPSWKVAW